jgi:hypothetical protein
MAVFFHLGSAKGRQGLRETEFQTSEEFLAVLNLYVQIKILVTPFDTNHSVTDSTLTINRCLNPEASWFYSQIKHLSSARHEQSRYVRPEDQVVNQNYLAVSFLEVMYIQDKKKRVFNFIFHLFLKILASSISFVVFLRFWWAIINRATWT